MLEKVSEILRQYGPSSVEVIAERLGVRVFENLKTPNLKEIYFPCLKAIAIRPQLPFYEREYLVAHGLGHHILHAKGLHRNFILLHEKGVFGSLERGRIEIALREKEADLFAGYLLVPEPTLNRLLEEEWVQESNDLVWQLALEFQVPKELMRNRLEYERMRKQGWLL